MSSVGFHGNAFKAEAPTFRSWALTGPVRELGSAAMRKAEKRELRKYPRDLLKCHVSCTRKKGKHQKRETVSWTRLGDCRQ